MKLTEKRAADRRKMADELERIATELGATVTRPEPLGPREIQLEIRVAGGARIGVDFDGDSWQPDVYVITWNVDLDSPACFADAMQDVNPFHYRKASRVCYGFESLCGRLRGDIWALLNGYGYDEERSRAEARRMIENKRKAMEYYRPFAERGEGTTFSSGAPHESPERVAEIWAALPGQIEALQRFIDGDASALAA